MPYKKILILTVQTQHDRAYSDSRTGFERDWVYGIVGADNESDISVLEVVVDFVHFEYNFGKVLH